MKNAGKALTAAAYKTGRQIKVDLLIKLSKSN